MLLTHKSEIKALLVIALPLGASFLAQKGMQLIDTIMMGWIGPEALAAGALGTAIFMTLLVFCMGVLSAVGIYISRARGAGNLLAIKSILQQGMYLVLLLSLPCMLLIWFASYFLSWIGEDPRVVLNTSLLLHGLMWGFPGFLFFLLYREFISSFALTGIVMVISILSIPLTFITNYVLIYGKLHLPALGIAGIGYAGAIIMWFMFLCAFLYGKWHTHLKKHALSFKYATLDFQQITAMLSLGVPSGLLYVLDAGMFFIAALLMTHFGVEALAAHQIAIQCATVAYSVPFAFSMAIALQVSLALGSQNKLQARRYVYIGITLGLSLALILASIFVLFPAKIIDLFLDSHVSNNQYIYQLAVSFLFGSALFQCSDALQAIMNGALRGYKDTFFPMLACLLCYWIIGVGAGYYLSFHTDLGPMGVWYGLVFGLSSAGLILILRFIFMQIKG